MSQQINLFNPVFMVQRKYFSLVTMLQGLGLIVLGSVLLFVYARYQINSLTVQLDEISKHYNAEQEKLNHFTEGPTPQEASQMLQDELTAIEAKLAAQNEVVETLKSKGIGNATGYSEYMRAFARQTVNGLWLSGFTISGDAAQMSISGSVLSPELLPIYMRKLNQEEVMRGKPFSSLQMLRGGNEGRSVEFTLQSGEVGGATK